MNTDELRVLAADGSYRHLEILGRALRRIIRGCQALQREIAVELAR